MKTNLFRTVKPLHDGARVALIAPSGILPEAAQIERARENARSLGWEPVLGENVSRIHGYLAGTDAERTADLNRALRDNTVDGIWCIRGGYGAMRLLQDIDYGAMKANPRPFIGFSDITAIHSAFSRECGIITFHGPTARGELSDFSRESFVRALVEQVDPCGVAPRARVLRPGKAQGRLAGGNLALVAALMGTPWAIDFDGAILILEDVDEAVYRVDRMMRQLLLADALSRCAAIVAGDFRPPQGETREQNRAVDDVLMEVADEAGIPCLAGAPFGHIYDQWTIPLGAQAVVDTDERSLRIVSD